MRNIECRGIKNIVLKETRKKSTFTRKVSHRSLPVRRGGMTRNQRQAETVKSQRFVFSNKTNNEDDYSKLVEECALVNDCHGLVLDISSGGRCGIQRRSIIIYPIWLYHCKIRQYCKHYYLG